MIKKGSRQRAATFVIFLVLFQGLGVTLKAQVSAEKWEELALTRLEVATGYDSRAEAKKIEAFKYRDPNSYETAGDLLNTAGDSKFIAFENYERAGQHWEKAAKLYSALGDDVNAKKAQYHGAKSRETAKRALSEGVELYRSAADMYENVRNLDKKLEVKSKIARNIERLGGLR